VFRRSRFETELEDYFSSSSRDIGGDEPLPKSSSSSSLLVGWSGVFRVSSFSEFSFVFGTPVPLSVSTVSYFLVAGALDFVFVLLEPTDPLRSSFCIASSFSLAIFSSASFTSAM
jgi:hypothetical protein